MRSLWVSRGDGDRGVITAARELPWATLRDSLTKTPKEAPDKTALGWWTPARFSNAARKREFFEHRDAITLDLDKLTPADTERVQATFAHYEYALHSSYSHTNENPRLRIVLPLSRPATYDEYQVVSRLIANRFDIELVDTISFRPVQITYVPGRPIGGAWFTGVNVGAWVDVDATLAELADWRDFGLWPRSQREDARPTQLKAENPIEKRGVVGAFCRLFDIHEVIEKYDLPYEPTSHPERYTYSGGSGIEGVVVYDDGLKAHSHHDTDPGRGQHNAFDLVRLHRFGSLDAGLGDDTPISKRPSYKAMANLARTVPEIQAELDGERNAQRASEFEVVAETDTPEWLMLPAEKTAAVESEKSKLPPRKRARAYLKGKYLYIRDQDGWADRAQPTVLLSVGAMKNAETHCMPKLDGGKRLDPVDICREIPAEGFHVDSRGYYPGMPSIYREIDGTDRLNLWTDPKIEELEPTADEEKRYYELLSRVLGDFSIARTIYEQALAYLVQNPSSRLGYAVVLSGVQGCGKSTLTDYLPRRVFGHQNVRSPENKQLRERFTGWALNTRLVSIAELWHADRRDAADFANSLKPYITEPTINIERKGEDAFSIPNRMSMFAQSNYRACISLQDGDRRWFIHWCDVPRFTEAEDRYFHDEFLNTDRAPGVLLWILRRVDTSGFQPLRAPAASGEKLDLIADSLPEPVSIIREAIEDGEPMFTRGVFLIKEVRALLIRSGAKVTSDQAIGRYLRHEAVNAVKLGRYRIGDDRPKVWTLKPELWQSAGEAAIAAMFDDLKSDNDFDEVPA